MGQSEHRLDLLKTLGDNTRYAIYLELARSPRPLATAAIAESLGLHANTVRPHLERMRDVLIVDPSEHVRRLVSEGTRTRLPWGIRLQPFIDDPSHTHEPDAVHGDGDHGHTHQHPH